MARQEQQRLVTKTALAAAQERDNVETERQIHEEAGRILDNDECKEDVDTEQRDEGNDFGHEDADDVLNAEDFVFPQDLSTMAPPAGGGRGGGLGSFIHQIGNFHLLLRMFSMNESLVGVVKVVLVQLVGAGVVQVGVLQLGGPGDLVALLEDGRGSYLHEGMKI
jgi:hypothetical protein